MARRRDKGEERAIACARIDALLAAARAERLRDAKSPLPGRHGQLALRVAQKYQSGLTREQKAALCRKCGADRAAASARIRVRNGVLVASCLVCGAIARRPLAGR